MRFTKMKLKKLNNCRDLGGLPAEGGKTVKYGKLIRSSRLYKLPKITVKALKDYGVTTIVDLRTENEQKEKPRTVIEGINYVDLPILTTSTAAITNDASVVKIIFKESERIKTEYGTADNYMKAMYVNVLLGDTSKEQLKRFIDLAVKEEGCILWFCNQGKDRTGIISMLLEGLLGVDEETIVADYVASAKFLGKKRRAQKLGLAIVPCPRRYKLILRALINVKPQYIRSAIDEINSIYGSISEYCKQHLGVTQEDINTLKEKYLERV